MREQVEKSACKEKSAGVIGQVGVIGESCRKGSIKRWMSTRCRLRLTNKVYKTAWGFWDCLETSTQTGSECAWVWAF